MCFEGQCYNFLLFIFCLALLDNLRFILKIKHIFFRNSNLRILNVNFECICLIVSFSNVDRIRNINRKLNKNAAH